ncbi:MAG: hypothetical protein DCC65_07485 [Planctomycetota bacterium]|nr:MAG: hypothetical protein DCC65_07485 [Planctomycetota bacterium]
MLWQHVRTLRFKLTFLHVLIFGVILSILSVVVLTVWEANVLASVDERLQDRADSALDSIERAANEGRDQPLTEGVQPQLRALRQSRYYFQLRSATGESIIRSPNLRNVRLPLPSDLNSVKTKKKQVIETISGSDIARLLGADGQMRVLTRYCEVPGVLPFVLQVGLNMGTFNTSRSSLRQIFLMVVPVGLLLAGVASWLLARRSLSPIRRIAREAQALTAAQLDRRMPPPDAMDEVGEMVVTVNQMLDRLEDAFRAQERFVADAAHELKTPVAVVIGGAQVIAQKERTPTEYNRFLVGLLDEMRRLNQMVDSLLTLARADAGMPLIGAEEVSINEIVADVVQRWQPLAQQKSVRLVASLAMPTGEEPEPLVLGDPELLDSMVGNLVQNGVRYSPEGEAVDVEVRLVARSARITVRDRGPGIPPEHLDRVFERFYRVPRVESGGGSGTGLGLAIAKGVTRLHKGSIHVANRDSGGCEFVVELPLVATT